MAFGRSAIVVRRSIAGRWMTAEDLDVVATTGKAYDKKSKKKIPNEQAMEPVPTQGDDPQSRFLMMRTRLLR